MSEENAAKFRSFAYGLLFFLGALGTLAGSIGVMWFSRRSILGRLPFGLLILPVGWLADLTAYRSGLFNLMVSFLQAHDLMRFYMSVPQFCLFLNIIFFLIYLSAISIVFGMVCRHGASAVRLPAFLVSLPTIAALAVAFRSIPLMLWVLASPQSTTVYSLRGFGGEARVQTGLRLSPAQIGSVYQLLRFRIAVGPLLTPTAAICTNMYEPDTEIEYSRGGLTAKVILGLKAYNLAVEAGGSVVDMNCEQDYLGPMGQILIGIAPQWSPLEEALNGKRDARSIDLLIEALHDKDPAVREKASQVIEYTRVTKAIPQLQEALADTDPVVRANAIEALSVMRATIPAVAITSSLSDSDASLRARTVSMLAWTPGPENTARAIQALSDPSPDVRASAAQSLSMLRSPLVIDPLAARLGDGSPSVRRAAAETLGKLGNVEGFSRACPALIEATQDSDASVRALATRALGGRAEFIDVLVGMTNDPDENVRKAAATGLSWINVGPQRALRLMDSPDPRVRFSGLNIFTYMDCARVKGELLEKLSKLVNDPDASVRTRAIACYRDAAGPDDKGTTMALLDDPNPMVRDQALKSLLKTPGSVSFERLLSLLEDKDRRVRLAAMHGIALSRDSRAQDVLKGILEGKDEIMAHEALVLLGNRGEPPSFESLIAEFKSDKWPMREAAAQELGQLRDPRAYPYLIEAATSKNHLDIYVSGAAALALGHLGDQKAIPTLLVTLKEGEPLVRQNSATALGLLKAKEAIPQLMETLNDHFTWVQWEACGALGNIGDLDGIKRVEAVRGANPRAEKCEANHSGINQ